MRSAVEDLPEYKVVKEVIEKFDISTVIKFVLFVGVNDWGLVHVYYKDYGGNKNYIGSDALWYAAKDALIELKTFDPNKLTKHILDKLRFSDKERREQFYIISKAVGSDQVLATINNWIQDKILDENSLREVLEQIQKDTKNEIKREIPTDKILNLIMRTYSRFLESKGFRIKAEPTVLFDVHIAKVTLRLGLVKAVPNTSTRSKTRSKYLPVGFPLTGNKELRQKVVEAWDKVSENSGVSAWDIDAALWKIGRELCSFDDELSQKDLSVDPNQLPQTSCPYKRLGEEKGCPLKSVCESYSGDVGLRILSQRVVGKTEIVLFLDNLRKLL